MRRVRWRRDGTMRANNNGRQAFSTIGRARVYMFTSHLAQHELTVV